MPVFRGQRLAPNEGIYADYEPSAGEVVTASGLGTAQSATGAGSVGFGAIQASGTGVAQAATGSGTVEFKAIIAVGAAVVQAATGSGSVSFGAVTATGAGTGQSATGSGFINIFTNITASGSGTGQSATGIGFAGPPAEGPFDLKLKLPTNQWVPINDHTTLVNVGPDDHHPRMAFVAGYVPYSQRLRGDVVNDTGWLMHANKDTDDKAAPIEDKAYAIYPTPPVWNTFSHTGQVYSILEFTVPDDVLVELTELDVYVPGVTADDHYRLWGVNLTDNVIESIIEFDGDILSSPDFFNVPIRREFFRQNKVYRLYYQQYNSSDDDTQVAQWIRASNSNQNTDPGTGAWNTRNNQAALRINNTDNNSNDQSALIRDVNLIGTRVRVSQVTDTNAYMEWTINGINDGGSFVFYDVSNYTEGPNGQPGVVLECDITFQVPIEASTDYVTATDALASFPNVRSYIALDDPGDVSVPSNDGNAINLKVTEYRASDDWDFMALTS